MRVLFTVFYHRSQADAHSLHLPGLSHLPITVAKGMKCAHQPESLAHPGARVGEGRLLKRLSECCYQRGAEEQKDAEQAQQQMTTLFVPRLVEEWMCRNCNKGRENLTNAEETWVSSEGAGVHADKISL